MRITPPHDEPREFNIPYPVSRQFLLTLVNDHGFYTRDTKDLFKLIHGFVEYVIENHGWYKPYCHEPEGSAD